MTKKSFSCLICNSKMEYFFEKEYNEPPYSNFMENIGKVEYYKCIKCGFVHSKTHYELSNEKWINLNKIHYYIEDSINEKLKNESKDKTHQPPYLQQAIMIKILLENNIIQNNIIDYACGYGTLHNVLEKYFSINSLMFDPYIQNKSKEYVSINDLKKYKTVFNSALFEHIRSREDINSINSLVDEEGCFILHTVVCENIPCDNNWFYINPVHCAFHTNKSMQILMEQWNYKFSLYCPSSKCWILFKHAPIDIKNKITRINTEFQESYLFYKKGFVDYWKGF